MDEPHRDDLYAACRVLFGHELDPPFLMHLRESGLRKAWRRKALQTHPDRTSGATATRDPAGAFIEARRAYGLLLEFLAHRRPVHAHGAVRPPHQRPAAHRQPNRPAANRRGGPCPADVALPRRRLLFGEFLYHARAIPYPALIEALVWQRRQRDRFCEIGRRWGLLSDAEVGALLSARRPQERVGKAAQRLRLLTAFQVRTVLAFQRSRQELIGSFFVRRGLLTPERLEGLVCRLEQHNRAVHRS